MRPSSAKAKGRRLQDWVALMVQFVTGVVPDKAIMGEKGKDVKHPSLPYSIECKNVEKLNVWDAFDQAVENCDDGDTPIVFMRRNRSRVLAVLPAEWVLERLEINE